MPKKLALTVKQYGNKEELMGAYLSKEVMQKLGVKQGDIIFIQKGWSGAIGTRAVVREGELPKGEETKILLLTADRIYDGNMKEGMKVRVYKHDDWF